MFSKKPLFILSFVVIIFAASLGYHFYSAKSAAPRSNSSGRLVGYWTMDNNDTVGNGTATTTFDKSGYNRHATSTGNVYSSNGRISQAIKLSATTNYLDAGNINSISGLSGMTISLWMKPQTLAASQSIIAKWSTNQNSFLVRTTNGASDEIFVFIANALSDAGSNYFTTSNLDLVNNVWQCLTIIYDGTLVAGSRVAVYKNGVAITGSATGSLPATMTKGGTADLRIGAITGVAGMLSTYDDVRIYNYALSAQEVSNLYNSAARDYTTTPSRSASSTTQSSLKGLVGYWTMDSNDVSGINYYDKSGYSNTATSTGSPTITKGKIGQAATLNGSSQYLVVSNPAFVNKFKTIAGTISLWVKLNTLASSQTIVAGVTDGLTRDELRLDFITANNKLRYADTVNGANSFLLDTANNVLADTNWHMITINGDGSTNKLYVDGTYIPFASGSNSGIWFGSANYGETNILSIGTLKRATPIQYTNGSIDDVRIYNYALSAQEVANLYNSAARNYVSAPSRSNSNGRLVGYWTMDNNDLSGTTYYDKSGLGNNATSTGGNPTVAKGMIKDAGNWGGSQYLTAPASSFNFGTGNFTAAAWAKFTSFATYKSIFSKYNANVAGEKGFILQTLQPSALMTAYFGSGAVNITGATTLKTNTWYHFAMVRNGDRGYLYLNGILDGSATGLAANIASSSRVLEIGSELRANYMAGSLDDVRVYNYALSAQEVANLYNSAARNYK